MNNSILLGLFVHCILFKFKFKVKTVKKLKSRAIVTRAQETSGSKSSRELDPTGIHAMTTVGADVGVRLTIHN